MKLLNTSQAEKSVWSHDKTRGKKERVCIIVMLLWSMIEKDSDLAFFSVYVTIYQFVGYIRLILRRIKLKFCVCFRSRHTQISSLVFSQFLSGYSVMVQSEQRRFSLLPSKQGTKCKHYKDEDLQGFQRDGHRLFPVMADVQCMYLCVSAPFFLPGLQVGLTQLLAFVVFLTLLLYNYFFNLFIIFNSLENIKDYGLIYIIIIIPFLLSNKSYIVML